MWKGVESWVELNTALFSGSGASSCHLNPYHLIWDPAALGKASSFKLGLICLTTLTISLQDLESNGNGNHKGFKKKIDYSYRVEFFI
jgi:hypothetical protein